MLNFRKITTLLSFLLINILVTSCGCGDKEEKERKQLVAEEKKLTENFKKHFTPQQWDKIKNRLQQDKNSTPAELEKHIKDLEEAEGDLKGIENADPMEKQIFLGTMSNMVSSLLGMPGFSFKDVNQFKTFLSDLLALEKNFKSQAELKKK